MTFYDPGRIFHKGRLRTGLFIREHYWLREYKPDYPMSVFREYKLLLDDLGYKHPSYTSFYKTFYYLHKLDLLVRMFRAPASTPEQLIYVEWKELPETEQEKYDHKSVSGRSYYTVNTTHMGRPEWFDPQKFLYRTDDLTPLDWETHPAPVTRL